jgi:hypothetical protein
MVKRLEYLVAAVLGTIALLAILTCTRSFLPQGQGHPYIPAVNAIGVTPAAYTRAAMDTPAAKIGSIPVLSYHQMDNGCTATAASCTSPEYSGGNVTQRQFYGQMSWLHSHGYRTITAKQYVTWATGGQVMLPAKPVLLTVDDGIANFYAGATPVLQHFGQTMVSMVVAGFAQGAQDNVPQYKGWDATWEQLSNLPSDTWEFAFHAGPQGHTLSAGASCPYFYPCQRPGETAAAYRERVKDDVEIGLATEKADLGSRVDTRMWAVPFNDLAQAPNQPQSGSTPATWLNDYAAHKFAVVFVDGKTSRANQHYRYEVHGTDSLAYFGAQVQRQDVYAKYAGAATAYAPAGGQS